MGYQDIATQLINILTGITDINRVYGFEPKELKDYPTATVTALSHKDTFKDTASNQRLFIFMIRLYYRTDIEEDAETILRALTDQVIGALESNVRLNNAVDFARPTEARWLYQEREVPVRVVEIEIEASMRVQRSV